MLVASVIVDVSARAVDRAFDYLVPQELLGVEVGCAVSVDFGNRPVVGYVVALRDEQDGALDISKYKYLAGILSTPYFDAVSAQLAMWIADEYAAPLSECVRLLTPPGGAPKIKRVDGKWTLVHPGCGPVDDRWVFLTQSGATYEPPANAVKQKKIIEALSCGGMRMAELSLEVGGASQSCKALERRGVVVIEERRRLRGAMTGVQADVAALRELTQGQGDALAAITAKMDVAGPGEAENVVVVDGITGSGKTEVYLRAIERCLGEGKSACVLVPEIALTPQTVGRFRARFGDDVAVLHSRLSTGERFDQWDIVRQGAARVVIGTRSALFAPLRDLGLIIIDEEHENSYKQDSSPRYDARQVALKLSQLRGAVLVLGSATPSITTLAACSDGFANRGWEHVVLTERPGGQLLPKVSVVDMAAEFGKGHRSMFSRELTQALVDTHEAGQKSILLLNKRGFASFVLCRECGFVPQCPDCSVSLTYHEVGNVLSCHHCGYNVPMPVECPDCGSPYLRKFGAGTQRVEDELRAVMPPGTPIIRMDADTTATKGAHEALLDEFASSPGAVLLGTQMIAKGLDFPDVTLVGVINADTTLKLPDFRAPERTYQLLEQVSGRAGRADKPGFVVIQTYCPDHPAVIAAATHNRELLLEEELPARRELGYPPYRRLANLLVWGKREDEVRSAATQIALALNSAIISAGVGWSVLGPSPCVLSRIKGECRWHILIKAMPDDDIGSLVAPILAKRRRRDGVKVTVDVDPSNLL